ncbi:AT hook motif-containing protein [Melia azedarach]|uniref:AT hook motif-containing protein n=1 Tax=Melia azedarach TaxID=155640 RepID=A0ACC1WVH1_MELAZ|nr:AT hook motif-containing protein [Melia azedarach]
MNQQSQGASSFSPADQPAKRKRGRPRKDDNQLQGENTPVVSGSDSVKKNKQIVGASNAAIDDMVGQMVSGVIEGSFDAGYLLNVKVGDTDTQLRGVVFLPGRFTPITAANDVAPNAKMYKRKEILIPVQNPQTQQHSFVPPLEQINRQASEYKTEAPKIPDQVLPPSEPESGVPTAGENQCDSVITTLADKLPINETGLSLGEKVMPQQISESALVSQTASIMAQLKHDIVVEQDQVQQETNMDVGTQTASIMAQLKHDKVVEQNQMQQETNMDIGATKKLEPLSAPFVDIMPCTQNVNREPQVELQPLSSDLKPNPLVHYEGKSLNIEDNRIAVFPKPESMSSEPVGIGFLMDNPSLEQNQIPLSAEPKSMPSQLIGTDIIIERRNSPRKDRPEDALLELANKTIDGEDKSLTFGESANITAGGSYGEDKSLAIGESANITALGSYGEDKSLAIGESANITAGGSYSAPVPSLSVMMFGGEAISSEPKLGTEGLVLPRISETQICSSAVTTNDADSDIKAALTHTHLDLSSGVNLSGSS